MLTIFVLVCMSCLDFRHSTTMGHPLNGFVVQEIVDLPILSVCNAIPRATGKEARHNGKQFSPAKRFCAETPHAPHSPIPPVPKLPPAAILTVSGLVLLSILFGSGRRKRDRRNR